MKNQDKIKIRQNQDKITVQKLNYKMSSNRVMSTEEIKKGLQNIKKAQLQVLKELRGDSFMVSESKLSSVQSMSDLKVKNTKEGRKEDNEKNDNSENIQVNGNRGNRSQVRGNNQKWDKRENQLNTNNLKSIRTNASSTEVSVSSQNYETLRKQFSAEREELKGKLSEISSKLNELERESAQVKRQAKQQDNQLTVQIRTLKQTNNKLNQQNSKLQSVIRLRDKQIEDLHKGEKILKSQLGQKQKENTVLQTDLKSLKLQSNNLSKTIRQLELQLSNNSKIISQLKQQRESIKIHQQSRVNMDLVMKQVRSISNTHDYLFNKLKESTTLEISFIEKENDIQNCFSRLLDYFEGLSQSQTEDKGETSSQRQKNYSYKKFENTHSNDYISKNNEKQSKELILKRESVSESRAEQREQLQYFMREMGDHLTRKQLSEMMEQNESLKKKVYLLTLERNNLTQEKNNTIIYGNGMNGKGFSESNRLISLELQDMREEVAKFKRFRVQVKEEHEELEKEIVKHKLKIKQLQAQLESSQRKLSQSNALKFTLQKKNQQQSIQITSLNSIIKELNTKLHSPNQVQSPLSHLRQQFTKLLQTNSLVQREKESIRAMNEGLQVQIQNLKYEKEQFESNNKQKHQLIEREIKQRTHLVQQIDRKDNKYKLLQDELEKLKLNLNFNEEQTLKARKNFQDLLQQKNQEVLQLRKQIEELYKQLRQYHQVRFSLDKLQKQHKELARKSVRMGETLSHLWSVKEAEYQNINQVLGLVKGLEENTQEGSAHF